MFPRLVLATPPPVPVATQPGIPVPDGGAVSIGRDPAGDLAVDHPLVSWHHARIERRGGRFEVVDLGSTNGTFVAGRRVRREEIVPGGTLAVANTNLALDAMGVLRCLETRKSIPLDVVGLGVTKGSGASRFDLLQGVSLAIRPGELVGIMGPSGAGKTTLLECLNGYDPPSTGQVLVAGRDLYQHYDRFRLDIGYVPQDDILHPQLRVRDALRYTARLRLPPDTTSQEIEARIERVLRQLHIAEIADRRIGSPAEKDKVLSGGQRKRVNLAMELLTDPWLLFLDEPTSGLSSADALQVLRVLRGLADQGRTVLLSIHQPSLDVFQQMTHLLMLAKDQGQPTPARLAYYGPAYPDSIRFFQPATFGTENAGRRDTPEAIFDGLASDSAEGWARRFAASPYFRPPQPPTAELADGPAETRYQPGLHQWWILLCRNLAIKCRDYAHTAILLLQAPLIGLLVVMVFGSDVRAEMTDSNFLAAAGSSATTVFLLAVATLWFGCSNAAREVVAERAIYHRERMVNLKIPSYLGAKVAMLGLLGGCQCAALLAVVFLGCGLRGPWLPMLILLVLTALVGTALGLVLSALANTSEVAISLVPLILLPMVILGGIMQPVHQLDRPADILAQAMASRWSFEGLLLLESDARPSLVVLGDPMRPGARAAAEDSGLDEPVQTTYDVAERYFKGETRGSPKQTSAVLAAMFFGLLGGIAALLRSKDRSVRA